MGNKMLEEFYEHLDRLDKTGKKYAIWGAGAMGKSALSYINQHNSKLKYEFFVDNNPTLWGKNDVISPKEFFDGKMSDIDTVFICVYVADEVEEQLRKNGYPGKTMAVVATVFAQDFYRTFYQGHEKDFDALKNILADDISIRTIDTFLKVIDTGDASLWSAVNGNSLNKTLEQDILKLDTKEYFVDIGAFTGDTIKRFLDVTCGKYKKIVCFEPEPNNFKMLKEYLSKMQNVALIQAAISEKNGTASFSGDLSEGGSFSANGNIIVDVKQLDGVEDAKDASFIKISTLGYELPGIKGAMNIIKNNQPKLAYYCGGSQMWDIPQYLLSYVPNYKFYIRHYGVGLQGLIGYAVPEGT